MHRERLERSIAKPDPRTARVYRDEQKAAQGPQALAALHAEQIEKQVREGSRPQILGELCVYVGTIHDASGNCWDVFLKEAGFDLVPCDLS